MAQSFCKIFAILLFLPYHIILSGPLYVKSLENVPGPQSWHFFNLKVYWIYFVQIAKHAKYLEIYDTNGLENLN